MSDRDVDISYYSRPPEELAILRLDQMHSYQVQAPDTGG